MIYFLKTLIILGIINVFIKKKQLILVLLFLELIMICIGLLFLYHSIYMDDMSGLFFSLIIIIVGATESAIGLSLIILIYKYIKA